MTDPNPTDEPSESSARAMLGLSLTQLVGGALAAATGAALASRLGVAGTILGAAAISLVSAVAGAAYTESLRTTRARIRTATTGRRPSTEERARPAPRRRLPLRSVLAGAAAVFVVAFAAITSYEVVTGEPLGGAAGRTTLGVITRDDDGGGPPTVPTTTSPTTTAVTSDPTTTAPTTSGTTSAPTTEPTPTPSTTGTTPPPPDPTGTPTPPGTPTP